MTIELTYLTWVLVLALLQIALTAALRTRVVGLSYNVSPRDVPAPAPPGLLTGRVYRAQQNLLETLPIFIAAIVIAHIANRDGDMTRQGAALYFWARLAYVPVYAFGLRYVRTIVWAASVIGIVMVLSGLLQ